MRILTRFILLRFLGNFALLFAFLFLFGISIDVIIGWGYFTAAADRIATAKAGMAQEGGFFGVLRLILEFHGPRIFQFYQFMMPLIALGAMGFTASAMMRSRELVALLAIGVSMRRAVMPMLLGMAILCVLQLVNQEFLVPHLRERLLLAHNDIGRTVVKTMSLPLTTDSQGRLIHAARFDPSTETLTGLYALERSPEGAVVRRIEALSATWSQQQHAWILHGGKSGVPRESTETPSGERRAMFVDQPIELLATDLDPKTIALRQRFLMRQMLSSSEVAELSRSSAFDPSSLARLTVGKYASLLIGFLVVAISIPFFALREPVPLLPQAVRCAAVGVPLILTGMIVVALPLSPLTPTVGVFLPVALLIPVAVWRFAFIKT